MLKRKLVHSISLCLALAGCQQNNVHQLANSKTTVLQSQKSETEQLEVISSVIPQPAQMKVDIIATARVSTLNHIDIVNVGKKIPYTYSEGKINNSPGFNWYVSKHFALKSDRPIKQVKLYLELLEMSYPHYKELFGAEPANIENQRIAAVYGSSKSATKVFVTDDGLQRGISAGGEAMYYNLAGYSFPSAREQHQRYIVIHEQGHAFQMALMDYPGWLPTWFTEGTADALAHHYYDPKKKQLKVMVFDRGSPMDYIRLGLNQYEQLNQPSIEDMTANPQLYRGINFLIVHFMLDDPKRSHLFKAYRDEMAQSRKAQDDGGKALSQKLMLDIFDDWPQVEKDFTQYVANIDKTFNVASGPWEQDGNQYWVKALNNNYELGAPRLDMYLKPNEKPQYVPFKFDQPLAHQSPLIGDVNRGSETPSVAIEVAYKKDHLKRGHVGIAMGVSLPEAAKALIEADKKVGQFGQRAYNPDHDNLLSVTIEQGETLVVVGQSIGANNVSYALPFELVNDLVSQVTPKLGLQLSIGQDAVNIRVTSANQQFTANYKISEATRTKLLTRPMGLLAQNAEHRITPYFDDGRDLNPLSSDVVQPSLVNPWSNPADKAISRLTRAIWRLQDKAPLLLSTLNQQMIEATTLGATAQLSSLTLFNEQLPQLIEAINHSGQSVDLINRALVELSGLQLRLVWRKTSPNNTKVVSAVLKNSSEQSATMRLDILQGNLIKSTNGILSEGDSKQINLTTTKLMRKSAEQVIANADVNWLGAKINLHANSGSRPYPWSSMEIVEQAKLTGDTVSLVSEFRGPYAGITKGKVIVKAYPSDIFVEAVKELEIEISPYEIRRFANQFKLKADAQSQPYAIDVSFEVEIDGEAVLIKQRSKVKFL